MSLTIVMYHYVRDLQRSPYPRIKGLTVERFEQQLDHITSLYRVFAPRAVAAAARGEASLPDNACLLTFDDGLRDHYRTVLPILRRRGLSAGFYPPSAAVGGGGVLDVHKIHFVLASVGDSAELAGEVLELVAGLRSRQDVPSDVELRRRHGHPGRFDPAEVAFIKRVLQHGLAQPARGAIVGELFRRHVTVDEAGFAGELYVSLAELREMVAQGMEVGGHGHSHEWLAHLDAPEQAREIRLARQFLAEVYGAPPQDWIMSYPYGSYDDTTLALLRDGGCALGLTTRVAVACDLTRPLELPRLDTNDLPPG